MQRVVTAASRAALATADTTILTAAIAAVMVAMTVIDATAFARPPHPSKRIPQHLTLAAVTLTLAMTSHIESPLLLIAMIAVLCVTQLGVSLARTSLTPQLTRATSTRLG